MDIHEQRQGAVTVLKPQGPLTNGDADELKARASAVAAAALGRVAMDLSAVPFVDSRGLEVLVELADELGQSGRSLKICSVTDTLREVFDLTGIGPQLEYFEDANAAVRSFL